MVRDITERVVIASKGRFDRAKGRPERERSGLPSESTIDADEFMAATLDVWDIPPESARRVGHPAPFPVELPQRLIELYTYRDDLVLDPFLGSGSTAVAAARTGRRWAGYAESGKTFLLLVFPAHVVCYLPFHHFGARRVLVFVRDAVAWLVLIYLFLLLITRCLL